MRLHTLTLLILLLPWTACSTERRQAAAPERPPNIIFILADDLGYGDLGSYGQRRIQTPNLDRMADEGMRFTDHYAGSTVCAPSRCVLMTGLHTGHCRIRGNAPLPLAPADVTVAERLKEGGYTTGLIGKWRLGEAGSTGVPNRQGFDYFFGYLNQIRAHNYYPDYLWQNEDRYPLDNVVETVQQGYAQGIGSYATEKVQYSHDLFTEEALAFVERNQEQPFFLYLAYTIPHANNESRFAGEHGMEVPDYGPYADEDWPEAEKGAAAMISRLDADVGRLLEHLKMLGLDEHTLVLFSSDNGPHREGGHDPTFFESSGPLRGIKRALYDGGLRVPLIARWPGRIQPGAVTDHPSAFWDVLPTAVDAAGLTPPEGIDGISYLPTLLGQEQPAHDYLYWEFFEQGAKQAIRRGIYKAVYFWETNQTELYDLSTDPGEARDLAAQYPNLAESLHALMRQARTPSEHWSLPDAE